MAPGAVLRPHGVAFQSRWALLTLFLLPCIVAINQHICFPAHSSIATTLNYYLHCACVSRKPLFPKLTATYMLTWLTDCTFLPRRPCVEIQRSECVMTLPSALPAQEEERDPVWLRRWRTRKHRKCAARNLYGAGVQRDRRAQHVRGAQEACGSYWRANLMLDSGIQDKMVHLERGAAIF